MGKGCAACLGSIDSSTREALCDLSCPIVACLETGERQEGEALILHAEGRRIPVAIRTVPMTESDGTIVGAIQIFRDVSALKAQERRVQELEELALLCPLTGIGNRRHTESILATRLHDFDRHGWRCGVLFIDIDHFKATNDRYGHEVGDGVLRQVARTLQSGVRGNDYVGRWGGEEFVAVLANVDKATAAEVAERCRGLIAETPVRCGEDCVEVTVSVGAALSQPEDDVKALVQRADRRMYAAKQSGRNRVVAMDETTQPA
jgi:diguanylate cyclase (GGDEF)-like protein